MSTQLKTVFIPTATQNTNQQDDNSWKQSAESESVCIKKSLMCFYFSLHSLPPDLPDDPEEPGEVRATDTPEHIRPACSAAQCYLESVTETNITSCAT